MIKTAIADNTSSIATFSGNFGSVAQIRNFHQSAAVLAAGLVRSQYARESKSKFRRECLEHLRASLIPEQKALA